MSENFGPESKREEPKLRPEGVSFETPIGQTYDQVKIDFPDKDLSIREAFKEHPELRDIIGKAREFKMEYPGTFNGVLLGDSEIKSNKGNTLELLAQRLHYHIYFAAHQLRQEQADSMKERYAALSTAGVVYDRAKRCFYMSVRPKDSQEQPGLIDAPGGVLNPDFKNADPMETIKDRFTRKLGLKVEDIKALGLERFFDEHYSLYNIAMYGEIEDSQPTVDQTGFAVIPFDELEDYLKSNKLTGPAKATLLLALSQDQFKDQGWGKERVSEIMQS